MQINIILSTIQSTGKSFHLIVLHITKLLKSSLMTEDGEGGQWQSKSRCCTQHVLFCCLITIPLLPPNYLCYRHWEISFLVLHCWIKIGLIYSCKICGATYLIWEWEIDIDFKIHEYPRTSNRSRARDRTYEKYAESAHMKECRQQANIRHQRLYRQHNILPTCHKYKPTWSGNWSCGDCKTIAY